MELLWLTSASMFQLARVLAARLPATVIQQLALRVVTLPSLNISQRYTD